MRLRDEDRLTRTRHARDHAFAEWHFGKRELSVADEPNERGDGRALEVRLDDYHAVACDQLRYAARQLQRDLALVERPGERAPHELKPLEALRLTRRELRQADLLDVMHHLLREQLDRAQPPRSRSTVVGRVAEHERRHVMTCRSSERHDVHPARAPLRPAPLQVRQREHLVLLHADGDASRAVMIAFANRNAHATVPDRVDRVNEHAKPLIERRRPRDVGQRGVEREIVIPVTKERPDATGQRRRERREKRYFLRGPWLVGCHLYGVGSHRPLGSVPTGGAPGANSHGCHCFRGTSRCTASGSTTTSNGVIPTRSPSACTGLAGSVSMRIRRPAV